MRLRPKLPAEFFNYIITDSTDGCGLGRVEGKPPIGAVQVKDGIAGLEEKMFGSHMTPQWCWMVYRFQGQPPVEITGLVPAGTNPLQSGYDLQLLRNFVLEAGTKAA